LLGKFLTLPASTFFAVVAGIFLLRGSLRAAGIVVWFSAFYLTGFSCVLAAWPLFLPPGLALAEVRMYPGWCIGSLALLITVLGLSYWIVRQLSTDPVLAARTHSGRKIRSLRGAFLAGVGLVAILVLVSSFTSNRSQARERGCRRSARKNQFAGEKEVHHGTATIRELQQIPVSVIYVPRGTAEWIGARNSPVHGIVAIGGCVTIGIGDASNIPICLVSERGDTAGGINGLGNVIQRAISDARGVTQRVDRPDRPTGAVHEDLRGISETSARSREFVRHQFRLHRALPVRIIVELDEASYFRCIP
jgi:hypothetical protein